jgi:hypothetical protein
MANLITWANYCGLTNTSLTDTNKTWIETYAIPSASASIEKYCDRLFTSSKYQEWTSSTNVGEQIFLKNYPVDRLYAVYYPGSIATISNTGTKNKTLVVNLDSVTIYDSVANSETDYLFSNNLTLSALVSTINAFDPTFQITITGNSATSTSLLMPMSIEVNIDTTNADLFAAINPVQAALQSDSIAITGLSWVSDWNPSINPQVTYDKTSLIPRAQVLVVYRGGYVTIPMDLQNIVARMIKDDMLSIYLGKRDTNMKSESIDQYSYTLNDGFNLSALCYSKYSAVLADYRRNILG